MLRLEIAEREIRSFMRDRLTFRAIGPDEVAGLAKLREALALVSEAKMACARADCGARISRAIPVEIKQKMECLD